MKKRSLSISKKLLELDKLDLFGLLKGFEKFQKVFSFSLFLQYFENARIRYRDSMSHWERERSEQVPLKADHDDSSVNANTNF